jgi:predicted phosphodiesterase
MRILVISDIHANLTALETVLKTAGEDYDAVWCLGDVVGYGPDPNECIERILGLPEMVWVLGNHDAAVIGDVEPESFNPEARISIEWTREAITPANRELMNALPKRTRIGDVTLVHGSPRDPTHEYLLDRYTATISFAYFDTPYCFFGHTHIPTFFHLNNGYADLYVPQDEAFGELEPRLLVNPGSVGQPRDKDPRAAFALYDTEANIWHHQRVAYDIPDVQKRMKAAKLPERHIKRLENGI